MTAHDRHIWILLALVLLGLVGSWFKLGTADSHDVLLISIGALTIEISTKDGEK